jgi:hypothetical protein
VRTVTYSTVRASKTCNLGFRTGCKSPKQRSCPFVGPVLFTCISILKKFSQHTGDLVIYPLERPKSDEEQITSRPWNALLAGRLRVQPIGEPVSCVAARMTIRFRGMLISASAARSKDIPQSERGAKPMLLEGHCAVGGRAQG